MDAIELMEGEEFRQVNDYPGYWISNLGRCYSEKTRNFIGTDDGRGYIIVGLCNDDGRKCFRVHRLVMQYFGPPQPEDATEVDHLDRDRANNRAENLRWVTKSENNKNRGSTKGVQYELFDEIPADDDNIIDVRDYDEHEFEDLYFVNDFFYVHTGVNFRRLHINYEKRGTAFVSTYDTNGKRVKIYYTKFKRLYELE